MFYINSFLVRIVLNKHADRWLRHTGRCLFKTFQNSHKYFANVANFPLFLDFVGKYFLFLQQDIDYFCEKISDN